MSFSKYVGIKERQIANQILVLRRKQKKLRNEWLNIDIKIINLNHKINNKYDLRYEHGTDNGK